MKLSKSVKPRPKLTVTPRNPSEGFIKGGLNSATPTPMMFVSSTYGDSDPDSDCKTFSSLVIEDLRSPTFSPVVCNLPGEKTVAEIPMNDGDEKPVQTELNAMVKEEVDSQSISSARYKAMMPSRLPITSSSPHLTISPGISPATLLESPIFFSMSQTDPSPTTGMFSNVPSIYGFNNSSMDAVRVMSPERNDSFIFKPHLIEEKNVSLANISLGTLGMPAEVTVKPSDEQWQTLHVGLNDLYGDDVPASDSTLRQASSFSSGAFDPQDHLGSMSRASAAVVPPVTKLSNGRLSTDGYKWKKYGQKTLKNCENPRSYYKCTHPHCPAKKQVECSLEGELTEIIYKGKHNHAKPQGTGKGAKNGSLMVQSLTGAYQNHDNLFSSYVHSQGGLPGTSEFSFTSPSIEDVENGEANLMGDDGESEHHSKCRRIENGLDGSSRESVRTTRESRVVVQTVSEKDILDDGYRWRKYGQKVVKGHYHPRNYYKCTNIGCKVRKHIERSSLDATCVITTYEGKHNHSVPPSRGSIRETEEESITLDSSYPGSPRSESTYAF